MKIYHDSTFVDPSKESEWLVLSVINRFDWETKMLCFKNGIAFCLKKNTAISNVQYKSEIVEPDASEKEEIIKMGYKFV